MLYILMNSFFNYSINDDYETPIEFWRAIEPLISKDLKINDPFYMNGNAKKKWKELGRNIIHEKKDFYKIKKNTKKEIYVSNPPHHKFHLLLEHLFYLEKPFIMLIPINRIAYIKTQKIIRQQSNIQIIPSPIYTGFITADGIKTPNCPQYYCFLCWQLYLEKDLLFLEK